MNQEFVYGKLSKVAGYVFGLLFMALAIYFFNSAKNNQIISNSAIGAVIFLMGVYIAWDVYRKKVIITTDTITYYGSFKTTTIYLNDIKGYESEKNNLIIRSKTSKTTISISNYVYLANHYKLLAAIAHHGVNLDQKQYDDELREILDDPEIGYDQSERKATLKSAKWISSYVDYTGGAIGLWAMLYPHPYNIAIAFALLYPLVALAIFNKFKNIISLVGNAKSARPLINVGLIMPAIGLFLRAIVDYDLINYKQTIMPTAVFFAVACFVFFMILPKNEKNYGKLGWLWMGLFAIPYCFGATIQVNCLLDDSLPVKFNTIVQSKDISTSKGKKHYNLTLTPWERGQDPKQIEVTQTEYEQTPVDGPVGGHIKSGYLHIRWFYLDM